MILRSTFHALADWSLRTGTALIVFVTACGCANTNTFQQPIAAFSTATSEAASAIQAYDSRGAKDLTSLRQQEALKNKRIFVEDDTCTSLSKSCVLTVQPGDLPAAKRLNNTTVIPHTAAFMTGIRDYAAALGGITKADASADVKSALGKALGALSGLSSTLDLPAGAALAAISQPLTDVGTWGFLQYQSSIKLAALQKATAAAQPILAAAQPLIEGELQSFRTARLAALEEDFDAKSEAFDNTPSPTNAGALVNAANTFDAALLAKPDDVFAKLVIAHDALTQAIASPKPDLVQLTTDITVFAQQVNNIRIIAGEF
jgi:hypothetical protein